MSLKINVTDEAAEDAIRIAELLAGQAGLNTSDRFLEATTQVYRLQDFGGYARHGVSA